MKANGSAKYLERKNRAVVVGQVFRDARLNRGLSQIQLGIEAEIDRTYPSLLERGLRMPTVDVFLRIAAVVRVQPAELMQRIVDGLE